MRGPPSTARKVLTCAAGAVAIWFLRIYLGWDYGRGMALAMFGINVVLVALLAWWLDRGRIVSGSVAPEAV